MRHAKNDNIILKEIYFDTLKKCYVQVDSIQDTRKGPYIHYQNVESKQWGRKPETEFLSRFEITRPIGSSELKKQAIAPQTETVSNSYNNVIYVDFQLKKVL